MVIVVLALSLAVLVAAISSYAAAPESSEPNAVKLDLTVSPKKLVA